jgi:alkanesulfonate monooxygenase SsuD/methylene tetrahydromethanopterin reductase-like flavin-dependent oxidoreductase (luciferase family)
MDVGVGLPSAIPGVPGTVLTEWARRADAGPFSSLGVLDRVAYDSYDPLIALAVAASVTKRVQLAATVVIGPLRGAGLLAKEALALDALSGGRFTLGLAVGARLEDYRAAGASSRDRGKRLNEQLDSIRSFWESSGIGPPPFQAEGPDILVGGTGSDQAFARVARFADGFIHGGGPPAAFASAVSRARAAWIDADRPGRPKLWGQGYFALGDAERGAAYLRDYYAFTGPFADRIAAGLLTTPQAIKQYMRGYEDAGCDELELLPAVGEIEQLDRLADVVGSWR